MGSCTYKYDLPPIRFISNRGQKYDFSKYRLSELNKDVCAIG